MLSGNQCLEYASAKKLLSVYQSRGEALNHYFSQAETRGDAGDIRDNESKFIHNLLHVKHGCTFKVDVHEFSHKGLLAIYQDVWLPW